MFESFRDRDLKDTGSCDELGAGAPVVQRARGTTRESWIEGANTYKKKKNIHNEKASMTCELGLEESVTILVP